MKNSSFKKEMLYVILIICLVLLSSCQQKNTEQELIAMEIFSETCMPTGKYTFYRRDETGNVTRVFDHEWDGAYDFKGGVGRVNIAKKWGLIDNQGNAVSPLEWDTIEELDLASGLMKVEVEVDTVKDDVRAGYINTKGEVILPVNWDTKKCKSFHEGLAAVQDPSGYDWGYINANGELVIDYQWDHCRNFSEGLAAVERMNFENKEGNGWGYIDQKGNLKIAIHDWKDCQEFHMGITCVSSYNSDDNPSERWGIINSKGDILIEPKYRRAYWSGDGWILELDDEVLSVYLQDGKLHYHLYYHSDTNDSISKRGILDISKLNSII